MQHLQKVLGVSERFACRVTGQPRGTQRYRPAGTTSANPDEALRAWLRAYADKHPGRGFRPACLDARAEGWNVNHKKIQRLWREEGLRVQQPSKRHGISTTFDSTTADAPNRLWAVSFQFAVTTDGRPINLVFVIDEHTHECLGGLVGRSITAERLIGQLDRRAAQRGAYPAILRCADGPELACAAMRKWASARVGVRFIAPGDAWRNGYVEVFNSQIRHECLANNTFLSLTQARVIIGDWTHHYNHHRRQFPLGHVPPAVYAASCTHR